MTRAGVDGCPGGWFAVVSKRGANTFQVFPRFLDLLGALPDARILVDMPIGLLEQDTRQVETLARKLLGPRRSSVFPVPCRAAVYSSSYAEACEVNQRMLGCKISKQAWNICPKMRELDQALPHARGQVRESHPELNFALFSGRPLVHGKKSRQGIDERLGILEPLLRNCRSFYEEARSAYPRGQLRPDDILDAMVLLATVESEPEPLMGDAQRDRFGRDIQLMIPSGTHPTVISPAIPAAIAGPG